MHMTSYSAGQEATTAQLPRFITPLPRIGAKLVTPILQRIIRKIASNNPDIFERLGPHTKSLFVISPRELPFSMVMRPDPASPSLIAVPNDRLPAADARIEGGFMLLLKLVDAEDDGDAAFFSRDLEITGNTEAVVTLRNALDDMDGSIAEEAAEMFGPPGRMALARLRAHAEKTGL